MNKIAFDAFGRLITFTIIIRRLRYINFVRYTVSSDFISIVEDCTKRRRLHNACRTKVVQSIIPGKCER